jgi:hypothetical protein
MAKTNPEKACLSAAQAIGLSIPARCVPGAAMNLELLRDHLARVKTALASIEDDIGQQETPR